MQRILRISPGDLHARILEATRGRIRERSMTVNRLAALVRCTQPHISNVLNGRRQLTPLLADQLVTVLQLDPAELYGQEQLTRWAEGGDLWRKSPTSAPDCATDTAA